MSSFHVEPATAADHAAACRFLFEDGVRASRCLEMLASGEFDAGGLFVARAGRVCGAVLVQPLGGGLGLAYLGLIPSARGRGFGGDLLRRAIAESETGLHLSVDARNAPALRLYARHEFVEIGRREAFLLAWELA